MKRQLIALLFGLIATSLFAQAVSISGTWKVDSQFQHYLGSMSADDFGIQPFTGNDKAKALTSITFGSGGIASIILADGSMVASFYRPFQFGIKLQPQGGSDTELFLQPLSATQYLGAMTWTVPEGSYVQLILILTKQ